MCSSAARIKWASTRILLVSMNVSQARILIRAAQVNHIAGGYSFPLCQGSLSSQARMRSATACQPSSSIMSWAMSKNSAWVP